ncbi:MAG: ankyrin repeat domain-containing protein [Akkermansiaceae bacterium]
MATVGGLGYKWWLAQEELVTDREKVVMGLSEDGVLATPMQVRVSAEAGDVGMLNILGELGVSFDSVGSDGRDSVHLAMDNHQWGALEVVRKYAKDQDRPDGAGRTPLQKLMAKGYLNLAQSFVDHGAEVDFRVVTDVGEVPASVHFLKTENKKNFEFIINNAADLDACDDGGKSLLQLAVEGGDVAEGMKLIKYGADTSELKLAGNDAFIELIKNPSLYQLDEDGQIELLSELIQRGADVNGGGGDAGGQRPLSIAMREGHLAVFDLLLEHTKKDEGYVWEAIQLQRPEMLRSLLQAGVSADVKNDDGQTPFMAMLEQGDDRAAEVMSVLLDHGADADQVTETGQRALFAAIAARKSAIAQALVDHPRGADVHEAMVYPVSVEFRELFGKKGLFDWYCRNVRGLTPLMVAVLTDELYVAEDLIKKGANRTQRTSARSYPIQMAAGMKNVKMQQLVLGVPFEDDEQVRNYIIDLSEQKAYLYENGELLKSSRCSTGKSGYRTPVGEYVVSDKQKHKVSNIYRGAKMPYFQRFSCSDFGFHQGNTYAGFLSHGCIRLPMSNAKFFFNNSKVGDRVTIRK